MSNTLLPRQSRAPALPVQIFESREAMGRAAADAAASCLRAALTRGRARVIFACAPSQDELLNHLCRAPDIAWSRVTVFHMDEYVGLAADHPASFRQYLRTHLLSRVAPGMVHELAGDASNAEAECQRYAGLLGEAPIDLVCLGIGENGHIAFNDPPVADFADLARVKVVELDLACRRQQVNDGCFPELGAVPRQALTLTIPALLAGAKLVCMVPGARKAQAVRAALLGPITTACPASVLQRHAGVSLFLDSAAAPFISP